MITQNSHLPAKKKNLSLLLLIILNIWEKKKIQQKIMVHKTLTRYCTGNKNWRWQTVLINTKLCNVKTLIKMEVCKTYIYLANQEKKQDIATFWVGWFQKKTKTYKKSNKYIIEYLVCAPQRDGPLSSFCCSVIRSPIWLLHDGFDTEGGLDYTDETNKN